MLFLIMAQNPAAVSSVYLKVDTVRRRDAAAMLPQCRRDAAAMPPQRRRDDLPGYNTLYGDCCLPKTHYLALSFFVT
jgi:hypothetical protein